MKTLFLSRALSGLSVSAALALATAGCPAEDPCGEPSFGGRASDESYRTMLDARDSAVVDDGDSPVVTTPGADTVIDAAGAAPVFAWSSALSASLGPSPRPSPALAPMRRSPFDVLSDIVIPKAHAHLPPVTGDVYLAEIAIPDRECPVAAHTTDLEWQLSDDDFGILKEAAGKDLTLTITSAYLTENRVSEGPYKASAPTTFRLE